MILCRKRIVFVVIFPFQMDCNADNNWYIYKDQDSVEEVMVGRGAGSKWIKPGYTMLLSQSTALWTLMYI